MFAILLASAVLASGGPTASAATPKPTPKPDDVVCRTETPPGSRFPQRVCMRRDEWARRRDEARRDVESIQNRADQMNPR